MKRKKKKIRTKRILAFQNHQHLEHWFRKIFFEFIKMGVKQEVEKCKSIKVAGPGFEVEFIFLINSESNLAGYHDWPIFYNIEYELNEDLLGTIDRILKVEEKEGKNDGID